MPAVDTPTEPAKPPLLARMPLLAGALEDVLAKVEQYTTAKEHHLLATTNVPVPNDKAGSDDLAQQWQACIPQLKFYSIVSITIMLFCTVCTSMCAGVGSHQ